MNSMTYPTGTAGTGKTAERRLRMSISGLMRRQLILTDVRNGSAMMRTIPLAFVFWLSAFVVSVGAGTYGLTGFRPVWEGVAPHDGIGVRFRFYVAENASESLKLIFSDSRLCGADGDTYLLEYNVYDHGLRFEDPIHTTWPMQGTYAHRQSSLRVAVPDYIRNGQTGARTFAPTMFPRQTYEIDGIDGLWKTDLISQRNLNGTECRVVMTRGDLVTELQGWRVDGAALPADTYRQWNVMVEFDDETYLMAFALPDRNAQYLWPEETLIFFTEFLHGQGLFRVCYWDFGILRETSGQWEPIRRWSVAHHDGSLERFGVRKARHTGHPVLEVSNDPQHTYESPGSIIDLAQTDNLMRGDADGDGDADRDDLDLVVAARNTAAVGFEDPRDLDGDGMITVLDARILVTLFTVPGGVLHATSSADGIVLEWNDVGGALKLQSTTDLRAGQWQDVGGLQSPTNAVIGTSAECMFFRLVLPE